MNKQILRLAIPNIISNLTVPLLSSVDTALVGHLDKIYYLGAIAVGGMIFNFIYWGFGFLRMGTTGLTAQAYGNKNDSESILILTRAFILALFASIILILAQDIITYFSFLLFDTTPEVEKYSRIYFNIRIYAAPATLGLYAFSGWFLGMQNAKYPLILAGVTNSLNVVFNIVFLKVFNMNVDGVALGTVCANYIGLFLAIFLFFKCYKKIINPITIKSIINLTALKKFFAINRDIFIRTLVLIFAFTFFIAKSAESGEIILAVNTILINLWHIMAYGIDGFAFAAESLIGKYFGAKDRFNLKKAVRYSFIWGIGLGLGFSLFYGIFAQPILEIFTNKEQIILLAMSFMIWIIFAPIFSSFCYIWDGIFIGATAGPAMRNGMLISLLIFFFPVYYFARNIFGNHSLWMALTIFMIARGLTLTIFYKNHIIKKISI